MKSRLPQIILLLLAAGYLVWLWTTGPQLPERVATHFDIHGQANGWMSRDGILWSMTCFGLGLPLLIVLAFHSPRLMPSRFINLPHREHWLAPTRRESTLRWIGTAGTLYACVSLLFVSTIHHFLIQANTLQPPRLANGPLLLAVGVLLTCKVALIVALLRHFSRPNPA